MCDEQKIRNFQGDFGMLLFEVKFDTVLSLMLISFLCSLHVLYIRDTRYYACGFAICSLFFHLDRPIAMT